MRSSQNLEPQNPWCLRFVITFLRSWWGPLAPLKRPVAIIFLIYSNCRQLKCPSCWDRSIQTRFSIRSQIKSTFFELKPDFEWFRWILNQLWGLWHFPKTTVAHKVALFPLVPPVFQGSHWIFGATVSGKASGCEGKLETMVLICFNMF